MQTNCQLPPSSLIMMKFPYGLYDFENQILKPQIKFNETNLTYSNTLKIVHKDILQGKENNKKFNDILFTQTGLAASNRSRLGLFDYEHNFIIIQLGYDFAMEAFDTLEITFNNINNPSVTGTLVKYSMSAYFGNAIIFDNQNFGNIQLYENESSGTSLILSDVQVFPKNRDSIASYEFYFEIISGIFKSTKLVIVFDNNFINLINGRILLICRFPFMQFEGKKCDYSRVLLQITRGFNQ